VNNKLNGDERKHLFKVKQLPCSVCDAPPPTEAHHVKQGNQYTCIALCTSCHRDNFNGLHGQKRMWSVKKMDELDALNVTIKRLMEIRDW
jgi:cytochrome c553